MSSDSPPRKALAVGGAKKPRTSPASPVASPEGKQHVSPRTPTRKRAEAINSFDDDAPALLPVGFNDPPEWEGAERPLWVNYIAEVPSKWPASNPVQHPSPWLNAMFIPPNHRAHVVCTASDLAAVHRAVFHHAAKEMHRLIGSTLRPVFGETNLPASIPSPHRSSKGNTERSLWLAAAERDDLALEYFGQKRGELNSVGYCILDGFCSDKHMPSSDDGDVISNMASYFESTFPGEEALRKEHNRVRWNPIVNTATTDTADRKKGTGRFITTLEGVAVHLEQEPSKTWVVVKRALLDVRLGQIIAAMRLGRHGTTRTGVDAMKIPITGGRFLLTGKGCPRQTLHTDFEVLDSGKGEDVPGYFVVCTSGAATPLWVVRHSHVYLRQGALALEHLSKGVKAQKVTIPPSRSLLEGVICSTREPGTMTIRIPRYVDVCGTICTSYRTTNA